MSFCLQLLYSCLFRDAGFVAEVSCFAPARIYRFIGLPLASSEPLRGRANGKLILGPRVSFASQSRCSQAGAATFGP